MNIPSPHLLIDAPAIASRVARLGEEIGAALTSVEPLFLGLLSGAEVFLADLVRAIATPVRFEFVRAEYGSALALGTETLDIHYPIPLEVRGLDLVVVKDVVSTGVTESYLVSQLRQQGAASVRLVALVDLAAERRTDFRPDWSAFALPRAGRLVGYGMKLDGRLGNLPYIAQFGGA